MTNPTALRTLIAFGVFVLVLAGLPGEARSQAVNPSVKALLAKVRAAYARPDYLSFRVDYTYANDGAPGQPVDSMYGQVNMDKERALFRIQGTETLVNSQYSLQVLPEDKIIYLTKSRARSPMDPVGMLDSALAHLGGLSIGLDQTGNLSVLSFRFPPGQAYTEIRMTVDTATGYLQQITYHLYTAGWVEKDQVSKPGHPAPYEAEGLVDVHFSHYAHRQFGGNLFDTDHFFTREIGRAHV